MMNETGTQRILPDHLSGSGRSFGTPRHQSIIEPILSKRVCFYKSGDPQFSGLRMVINNRTFKTFDALLDSLSKKVPLLFGVRNITTPRGVHAVHTLDELEDGKSYICSDSRNVKPINLALAQKKLLPWYHARPVSSRRQTVQQARLFPGQNIHKKERAVVRTPKRLLVYRNGVPTVRHTVVLDKRTTPTFESILEYISELIQFHVVKLHTPEGRRVDGFPGLILCSGIVVAAGREPFRPANYNVQKSITATPLLTTNRKAIRRLKSFNRKRKSLPYASMSRKFSFSSERYIVNQIHDSITASSCDLPSNPTNSVDLESGNVLESVAETEGDTCQGNGAAAQDCFLPTEDDIEKSFRVNQDGSMTVEMKVRLTIKEEETIHWTTTLTRSNAVNQLNVDCLPELEAEQEIESVKSHSLDVQSPVASTDTTKRDKTEDNNDEEPPSLANGALSDRSNEEEDIKVHMGVVSPNRAPTPGYKQIREKQASVESIKSVTSEWIEEGVISSFSYKEQREPRAMTEQFCMVKQSTKPVPKPRRFNSVDGINMNSRNVSTFESAGMTEILQTESSGEEVTETVLHIYEQQTCQDHFLANICAQRMSASGISFCRPATSGTGQLSSNNEFEPECWRPSTASNSIGIWRTESTSVTSDLTLPSLSTEANQATTIQQHFPNTTRGKGHPQQREVSKDKRVSPKSQVIKHVRRLPGKRQTQNSAEATKKRKQVKTFSSAGFIKKIYGNKSKSTKNTKLKKVPTQNGDGGVTTETSQKTDDTIKYILNNPKIQPILSKNTSETISPEKSKQNCVPNKSSQPQGILTRQTSVHTEKKKENESYYAKEIMSLLTLNASSSVTNEYVENWLEKTHKPTPYTDEEIKKIDAAVVIQTENNKCGENKNGLIVVAEEVKHLEVTSENRTCQKLKTDLLPDIVRRGSVKQRIQSFENKSNPSMEKKRASQQITHRDTTNSDTENCNRLAQNKIEEIKTHMSHCCSEMVPPGQNTPTEIPSDRENTPRLDKISLQNSTPSNSLSMDLPSPPPPNEIIELSNTEECVMDVSSALSSPLYRLSSVSSQISDNHPLSISPTSDHVILPIGHTMETTTSIHTDIPSMLGEMPLSRTPSIKRAPLVSSLSLDRKMSLRKACLDIYTLGCDSTSEGTTPSTPTNIVGDKELPNSICSTKIQLQSTTPTQENSTLDLKNNSSCCFSAYPSSLASEKRMSTTSISSSEASTPSDIPLKETRTNKTPLLAQREASSSPKPLVKKVKLRSSPSPDRKPETEKLSSEISQKIQNLSTTHNHPPDKTMSPNLGDRKPLAANASPSTEGKQMLFKPKLQNRLSPYSHSLDMVSPPVIHKSGGKSLTRNLSSDNASEPANVTQRRTLSERKHHQPLQPIMSTADQDKTLTFNSQADQSDNSKVNEGGDSVTEKIMGESQVKPQPFNVANQPNMKHILEEICYSIKSIRQITQNKRPSCLEKSNSLPDFSSHVASTFGSSSKALLAFLSVMTLKGGMTNLNMDELNVNNVSCAEALKMIDSLREIATIEESHKLKARLSNLQQSASKQLMQSWRGFQELRDKCMSRSTTPNDSEQELLTKATPDGDTDENIIDEMMDYFNIPKELKKELASLPEDVKNVSDDTEKMSTGYVVKVNEQNNVDVSTMIKKFTDIQKPKQSSAGNLMKTAMDKISDQQHKKTNAVANCQQDEPIDTQIHKEMQLYSPGLFEKENEVGKQEAKCYEEKSSRGKSNLNAVVSSNNFVGGGSCPPTAEEKYMKDNRHLIEVNMTIPANEETHDQEGSEQEGHGIASARKGLENKVSCEQSLSSSETDEHCSSEEERQVEREGIPQENREHDDLSDPEGHSAEKEDKQPRFNDYVELNASANGRVTSVEEKKPDVKFTELSKDTSPNPASPSNSEKEQLGQTGFTGWDASVEESTCNSDVDESSSEEVQTEVECAELKAIIEETFSLNEEEQESMEEKHLDVLSDQQQTTKNRRREDKLSSDCENHCADETKSEKTVEGDPSNMIENQHTYTKKDNSSLIKSDSLVMCDQFSADEDSGNDRSSCEENVEVEQPKSSSSIEEDLSYYEKESSSEEEHIDRYIKENCQEYQEAYLAAHTEVKTCENAIKKVMYPSKEGISQSIAERVVLLEKRVADAQRRNNTTVPSSMRRFSQRNPPLESDGEDSEFPTLESVLGTRSAPQSSLSFSYDSCGVIPTELEGNRVRSIREMFLAKSATDIQHGCFPSPNRSELSELRAETSVSGGYQSQTSSDLSSGEDDSPRKSITKGFVRRTIERLYGKKDANPVEVANERPPSAPKQKKIFSPFHNTQSKAVSELSYFNSTNALDTLSEATRCNAFNAQVRPEDSVPVNDGHWILRESTVFRKSVSDPVGINKALTNALQGEGMYEDTKEKTPYSLFSKNSELEDNNNSFSRKCTYFSLPHASDSDACQEEPSIVNKHTANGDSVKDTKDNSKDTRMWAEKNGTLPAVSITDFKMIDNKVHPLVELPPDGEVVVAQPGRGQGVVNRRVQEQDMLDVLYNFCGQNCPIL